MDKEIKVTPEMVKAGLSALHESRLDLEYVSEADLEQIAVEVFLAMDAIADSSNQRRTG